MRNWMRTAAGTAVATAGFVAFGAGLAVAAAPAAPAAAGPADYDICANAGICEHGALVSPDGPWSLPHTTRLAHPPSGEHYDVCANVEGRCKGGAIVAQRRPWALPYTSPLVDTSRGDLHVCANTGDCDHGAIVSYGRPWTLPYTSRLVGGGPEGDLDVCANTRHCDHGATLSFGRRWLPSTDRVAHPYGVGNHDGLDVCANAGRHCKGGATLSYGERWTRPYTGLVFDDRDGLDVCANVDEGCEHGALLSLPEPKHLPSTNRLAEPVLRDSTLRDTVRGSGASDVIDDSFELFGETADGAGDLLPGFGGGAGDRVAHRSLPLPVVGDVLGRLVPPGVGSGLPLGGSAAGLPVDGLLAQGAPASRPQQGPKPRKAVEPGRKPAKGKKPVRGEHAHKKHKKHKKHADKKHAPKHKGHKPGHKGYKPHGHTHELPMTYRMAQHSLPVPGGLDQLTGILGGAVPAGASDGLLKALPAQALGGGLPMAGRLDPAQAAPAVQQAAAAQPARPLTDVVTSLVERSQVTALQNVPLLP